MEQIFENLKDVGLATTVISLLVIFLVGCVKTIPAVQKIDTNWKKVLYQGLNIVFGVAISILYTLIIVKGGWDLNMLRFAVIVVVETNAIYPLYENLGLRQLWQKIVSLIFKKDTATIDPSPTETEETETEVTVEEAEEIEGEIEESPSEQEKEE